MTATPLDALDKSSACNSLPIASTGSNAGAILSIDSGVSRMSPAVTWRQMQPPPDFYRFLLETEALVTVDEARLLYDLASQAANGAIVEIGAYKGGSTTILALGSSGTKVYAVDSHRGIKPDNVPTYDAFLETLRRHGVIERVVPVVAKSHRAVRGWSGPISLLWIDGSHRFPAVSADFSLWEPYLIPGGILAFHDSCAAQGIVPCLGVSPQALRGPLRVVREVVGADPRFERLGAVDSITWFRKT